MVLSGRYLSMYLEEGLFLQMRRGRKDRFKFESVLQELATDTRAHGSLLH